MALFIICRACASGAAAVSAWAHRTTRVLRAACLASLVVLAGCGVRPDGSNGVHRMFALPGIGYQAAYERAVTYARTCHTGGFLQHGMDVSNEIFESSRTGAVHISAGSSIAEDIKVLGGKDGTQVDVVSIGRGYWSKKQLDRVQRSMESGKPDCS